MKYGKSQDYIVHQEEPFNGGAPATDLRTSELTPYANFYVRAHAPVPEVDIEAFRLVVRGLVDRALSLTLDELKQNFEKKTVSATLQCAGNRRKEFLAIADLPGESVMWGTEAISTAEWSGVSLVDVITQAGVHSSDDLHVAFVSVDEVEKDGDTFGYGGSIPLEKALRPEVLLAYEMNGEPLPPVHGYPLRVIVPGYVAARSVKWVSEVIVQDAPSDNYYQANDYKIFPPHINESNVDWSQGEMLGELRSDAVISSVADGDTLQAGEHVLRGYTIPAADAEILRVEVSTDGGETWQDAELLSDHVPWTWRFWQARVHLEAGPHELVVRLHDSIGTVQADDVRDVWNFKGYMNNSLHRINVTVE